MNPFKLTPIHLHWQDYQPCGVVQIEYLTCNVRINSHDQALIRKKLKETARLFPIATTYGPEAIGQDHFGEASFQGLCLSILRAP